jgi:hypothetical protein
VTNSVTIINHSSKITKNKSCQIADLAKLRINRKKPSNPQVQKSQSIELSHHGQPAAAPLTGRARDCTRDSANIAQISQ